MIVIRIVNVFEKSVTTKLVTMKAQLLTVEWVTDALQHLTVRLLQSLQNLIVHALMKNLFYTNTKEPHITETLS